MLRHILTIIWNNRNKFIGIVSEQMLVFIILMICVVAISVAVQKYNEPGLLNTERVMVFGYTTVDYSKNDLKEVAENMETVIHNLALSPNTECISEGLYFAPYLRSDEQNYSDSISVDRVKMKVFVKFSDRKGNKVFMPEILEGQWFSDNKCDDGSYPVIITNNISKAMQWSSSVGKKIIFQNTIYTIVGVIAGLKQNVFEQPKPVIILPSELYQQDNYKEISIKVKDKTIFSRDFYQEYNKMQISNSVMPYVIDLNEAKDSSMMGYLTGIIAQMIPTSFLFIFSFIGTLGIFKLNSQKRIKEYSLRIAVGATPNLLFQFVIIESIIITIVSIIPGLILSFFIYEYSMIQVIAILSTIILMFLFSIFSAWYPAHEVTKIDISKALNYE